jgi:hypothetical protein
MPLAVGMLMDWYLMEMQDSMYISHNLILQCQPRDVDETLHIFLGQMLAS